MFITANIHFEEVNQIRKGPLARVFLGEDKQLECPIVVKEVDKNSFDDKTSYFEEARILYNVNHPNIAELQYACEDSDFVYLTMPYYRNGALQGIYTVNDLSIRQLLKYAIEFLSGLHFIHSRGLVHLDVKPGNVLINDSNVAMLTDFGLSKYVEPNFGTVQQDLVYVTHTYPESFYSEDIGKEADIYQVGVTLYRMFNGEEFFNEQGYKCTQEHILSGKYPNRDTYLPHIPLKLKKVINKCLEVNPDDRYDTVLDIINDLATIDKNLDWLYNLDEDMKTHSFIIDGDTMKRTITAYKDADKWHTKGEQFSYNTMKTTQKHDWNSADFSTKIKAFKFIEKAIKSFDKK